MKKSTFNFLMAGVLFVLGLIEAGSGFLLWLVIPSGGRGRGVESDFWGIARTGWISIHDWVAIALTALVLVHLALHWKWLLRMPRLILSNMLATGKSQELRRAAEESIDILPTIKNQEAN